MTPAEAIAAIVAGARARAEPLAAVLVADLLRVRSELGDEHPATLGCAEALAGVCWECDEWRQLTLEVAGAGWIVVIRNGYHRPPGRRQPGWAIDFDAHEPLKLRSSGRMGDDVHASKLEALAHAITVAPRPESPRSDDPKPGPVNAWGVPAPPILADVDPAHFENDGPPHDNPVIEVEIILWRLGYHDGEPLAERLRVAARARAAETKSPTRPRASSRATPEPRDRRFTSPRLPWPSPTRITPSGGQILTSSRSTSTGFCELDLGSTSPTQLCACEPPPDGCTPGRGACESEDIISWCTEAWTWTTSSCVEVCQTESLLSLGCDAIGDVATCLCTNSGTAPRTEVLITVADDDDAARISGVLEALGYAVHRELGDASPEARARWAVERMGRRYRLTSRELDVLELARARARGAPRRRGPRARAVGISD